MAGCRALKPEEVAKIAARLRPRDRAWFLVGCSTGYRVSEVLQLKRGDFTTAKAPRRCFIDKSRMKGKKRGRVCWLDNRALDALKQWLRMAPDSEYCFPSPDDTSQPLSRQQAHRALVNVSLKLRLPRLDEIGTHSMRKTFAMKAFFKWGDIIRVSVVMGHQDFKSTMRYLDGCSERELWTSINGMALSGALG